MERSKGSRQVQDHSQGKRFQITEPYFNVNTHVFMNVGQCSKVIYSTKISIHVLTVIEVSFPSHIFFR